MNLINFGVGFVILLMKEDLEQVSLRVVCNQIRRLPSDVRAHILQYAQAHGTSSDALASTIIKLKSTRVVPFRLCQIFRHGTCKSSCHAYVNNTTVFEICCFCIEKRGYGYVRCNGVFLQADWDWCRAQYVNVPSFGFSEIDCSCEATWWY